MTKPQLFLIYVLICFSLSSYAQLSVEVAGKKYLIPSFDRQILTPEEYPFEGVKSIEESPNTLDIRFTVAIFATKRMIALKGNKQSLWAECYYYAFHTMVEPDPRFNTEEFKDSNGHPMRMLWKRIDLTARADSIMRQLTNNELFTMKDEEVLLDSLRQYNIPFKNNAWLDGAWGTGFTIKINDQYRRFTTTPEIDRQNPAMGVFANRIRVDNLFNSFYKLSGLPRF